jgi:hypothetical protein
LSIASGELGRDQTRPPGRRYADTPTTAAYLGVSTSFLEKNRVSGKDAIPYIKLSRKVLYDLDVIDRLMAASARINTSEAGGAAPKPGRARLSRPDTTVAEPTALTAAVAA